MTSPSDTKAGDLLLPDAPPSPLAYPITPCRICGTHLMRDPHNAMLPQYKKPTSQPESKVYKELEVAQWRSIRQTHIFHVREGQLTSGFSPHRRQRSVTALPSQANEKVNRPRTSISQGQQPQLARQLLPIRLLSSGMSGTVQCPWQSTGVFPNSRKRPKFSLLCQAPGRAPSCSNQGSAYRHVPAR